MRLLSCLLLASFAVSCGDKKSAKNERDEVEEEDDTPKKRKRPLRSASAAASGTAPPTAEAPAPPITGPFVRTRPSEPQGVDACAFLGGFGFACMSAYDIETDPVRKRYMRRLSDADARQSLDAKKRGEPNGVAHPEAAAFCKGEGACGGKDATGADLDGGYACLTKAQSLAFQDDPGAGAAHARACKCDAKRAFLPVMGGYLACDGPDKPVTRGESMSTEEANDVRACAECAADSGPAACTREIGRLKGEPELAALVRARAEACKQP